MDDYPKPVGRPFLLVLSGPSGSGKSTLIDRFRSRHPHFIESISVTTRSPRGNEREGVDYFFVSEARFQELIRAQALLEHAEVFGTHSYGTPRAFIDEQFAQGRQVIMDIDVQGALQIRANMPADSLLVFVTPPDRRTLEERLRGRGTDDDTAIAKRMRTAERELAQWRHYDYLIINDILDQTVADLEAIVRAHLLRIESE